MSFEVPLDSPAHIVSGLDGCVVECEGERWTIEVFGCTPLAKVHFVQIGLRRSVEHFVTLRLGPLATKAAVCRRLELWIADEDSEQSVIDVD